MMHQHSVNNKHATAIINPKSPEGTPNIYKYVIIFCLKMYLVVEKSLSVSWKPSVNRT